VPLESGQELWGAIEGDTGVLAANNLFMSKVGPKLDGVVALNSLLSLASTVAPIALSWASLTSTVASMSGVAAQANVISTTTANDMEVR